MWGHDLRVEGIVVEPMHGMDDLAAAVADFGPGPHRRLGILVDHLVAGSKETRAAAAGGRAERARDRPPVRRRLAGGEARHGRHPGVAAGAARHRLEDGGVRGAAAGASPADGARRVLGAVRSFRDLETPLIGAVEQLIDFVTV